MIIIEKRQIIVSSVYFVGKMLFLKQYYLRVRKIWTTTVTKSKGNKDIIMQW